MIGGYTWAVKSSTSKRIDLDVYLFISATRSIDGHTVKMISKMPWQGETEWEFDEGVEWHVRVPKPAYATNIKVS